MRWLLFAIAVATTNSSMCYDQEDNAKPMCNEPCFSAGTAKGKDYCTAALSGWGCVWSDGCCHVPDSCFQTLGAPLTAARGATREFAGDDLGTTLAIAIAVPLGSVYLAVHNGGVSV